MSALIQTSYANEDTPYFALAGTSICLAQWSTYPAVSTINASGNAIINISSLQIDAQILTADASDLFLNGVPVATLPDISNVSDWALYPALANVNMSNLAISNVSGFELDGEQISAIGDTILVNGKNPTSNWSAYSANCNVNLSGNAIQNVSGFQLDGAAISTDGLFLYVDGSNGVERWAQFPAVAQLNMSGSSIIAVDQITASGGDFVDSYVNNLYVYTPGNMSSAVVTSTNSGATLLLNSVPILTSADISAYVDTSAWATYPAVANVKLSGNSITSATDITLDASTGNKVILTPNASVSNDLEVGHDLQVQGNIGITSGGISQCNVVGSGVTNSFTAATTFGDITDLGYAEVKGANRPPGFSSFYVEGGVTFDGGTTHGFKCTTAGAGIFGLARFELTPLLIYIASAGPITFASVTYAILTALLNVRVAAGTFVLIEHGNTGGYDGIYIQNTLNNSGDTRVIWTAGGTQYNTGVVQTSNLFTPQPIQFWSNVYNPSGGSAPNAPTNSFGQSINPIAYTDVNRNNAILGNVAGWFNSKGVYDPFPNTTYSNLSTFSNTTLIGSFGGVVGNNGSTPYNFGSSSVHIGIQQISASYVGPTPPTMGDRMVAIGTISGWTGTGYADNIVIGTHSNGINLSGSDNVCIGTNAGTNVGSTCIAIGLNSGQNIITPNVGTISIGNEAGEQTIGDDGIFLGFQAGSRAIGGDNVCIGYNAGATSRAQSVSIGANAGIGAGSNCVSIGAGAGYAPVSRNNCIVINATGSQLSPAQSNSCYINPIRSTASPPNFFMTAHNGTTGELIETLTSSLSMDSTISNTQRISYDTGLLTTQIDGLLKVAGSAEFTQAVTADTTFNVLGLTTLSSLVIQNISAGTSAKSVYYNPSLGVLTQADAPTPIVASPAFVYYVATNGRVGASGSITDPLSTINEALTKPASTGGGRPGMTIFVATGAYSEDVVINISATLPAVSIIGMSDDDPSSKRVQITGSFTINGTDATFTNTIDTIVLNNLNVNAKNATTSAVTITGAGIRVYLKNGLYTNANVASVPLITMSSTGVLPSTIAQLAIDDCSITMDSATASGHLINVASGQIFSIGYSDLTHKGTGSAINMAGGAFSSATQTQFNTNGAVMTLVFSAASLVSLTNCVMSGKASTSVALISMGANVNLNMTDSTLQNLDTSVEVNNTSRYIYTTSATGNLIAAIRNNITNSRAAVTQITPFQAAVPAASQLLYFGNIYTNQTATLVGNLPAQGGLNWNAVRQFFTDTYTQTIQVVATSASAIVLSPTIRGKTFILTGTTTQAFSTTGFGLADAGFFVMVHNGNASLGGDINITGASGTTIIHNRTATQNGGILYLYWTGAALVGY